LSTFCIINSEGGGLEEDSIAIIHIINLALEAIKLALITFYFNLAMNLVGNDRLNISLTSSMDRLERFIVQKICRCSQQPQMSQEG